MRKKGFTLIELLVVVSIVGIMAALVVAALNTMRLRAYAGEVISNYKEVERAFQSWMTDTGVSLYPDEARYGSVGTVPCQDDPALSVTDLFSNESGNGGWDGPYLSKIPLTPWSVEYAYDNDGDFWNGNFQATGVNLLLQWCNAQDGAKARKIAEIIDQKIDNGNGHDGGIVRWTTNGNSGGIRLLLARQGES